MFSPDVDLLDAQGNWDPDPASTDNDCISVGVGFTAVRASILVPP
jgi:hypothetical protein